MTKFNAGDRARVANDATWASGGTPINLYALRGEEVIISNPMPDSGGDIVIHPLDYPDRGAASVDPTFLTPITDRSEAAEDPEAPVLVEVEDLSTLTKGQAVTLEAKTDEVRILATFVSNGESWITARIAEGVDANTFRACNWRVLVEKPKVELPTEGGLYLDREGDIWDNLEDHWLKVSSEVYFAKSNADHMSTARAYAPFTRLVPEGSERNQAIREIHKHVENCGRSSVCASIRYTFPEAFKEEK